MVPYQSGYQAGHSAVDALIRIESAVRTSFRRGEILVAVFLDISQAFDSLWHGGLMMKLQWMGLEGNQPHFIQQFLLARRISVRQGSTVSDPYAVVNGVPQGAVISPTLFIIMINDLMVKVGEGIQCSLYADDCAIWVSGLTVKECTDKIQAALNEIDVWLQAWGFQISTSKTKSMIFTHK